MTVFNIGKSSAPNAITFVHCPARRFTRNALNSDAREMEFLPKATEPISRIRHDYDSRRNGFDGSTSARLSGLAKGS